MKKTIMVDVDCEQRHCGDCKNMIWLHCNIFDDNLRETCRGVLRSKQCMEAEQKYKKLQALKTCNNCKSGPSRKCQNIKDCTRGWGDVADLWEGEK
jgi:hypothetical protein